MFLYQLRASSSTFTFGESCGGAIAAHRPTFPCHCLAGELYKVKVYESTILHTPLHSQLISQSPLHLSRLDSSYIIFPPSVSSHCNLPPLLRYLHCHNHRVPSWRTRNHLRTHLPWNQTRLRMRTRSVNQIYLVCQILTISDSRKAACEARSTFKWCRTGSTVCFSRASGPWDAEDPPLGCNVLQATSR